MNRGDPNPALQREYNVVLINFDKQAANRFHFSEEVWFQDRDRRRADGFEDVQRVYIQRIPEFIKYPIPFAICATRLEYGATCNPSLNAFYKWKDGGSGCQ